MLLIQLVDGFARGALFASSFRLSACYAHVKILYIIIIIMNFCLNPRILHIIVRNFLFKSSNPPHYCQKFFI